MDNFVVENLGPIAKADVTFGDLTILTGPQASGKTLFLETFKLVKDFTSIFSYFCDANYKISDDSFFDFYYGDKMHKLVSKDFKAIYNKKKIHFSLSKELTEKDFEHYIAGLEITTVHYIPAQRSSALSEGRIKLSDDFVNSPYVLVKFSNYLQKYVTVFPELLIRDMIK